MDVVFTGKNYVVTFPSLDFKESVEGCAGALSRSNKILYSISLSLHTNIFHIRYEKIMESFFKQFSIHPSLFL